MTCQVAGEILGCHALLLHMGVGCRQEATSERGHVCAFHVKLDKPIR